ncbi:hypothetical protein PPGU16_11140 [Paraburkholderia largidicola]|uniref:Uncharacterized protein n=1 Tax=Paraburkholderia largidicola TaxID=3014751 RepID=A0A7I8BHE0_9BURK|nr:hypothetical protein PPGU16_11140 [Paraburkholderia sp. PGU16]
MAGNRARDFLASARDGERFGERDGWNGIRFDDARGLAGLARRVALVFSARLARRIALFPGARLAAGAWIIALRATLRVASSTRRLLSAGVTCLIRPTLTLLIPLPVRRAVLLLARAAFPGVRALLLLRLAVRRRARTRRIRNIHGNVTARGVAARVTRRVLMTARRGARRVFRGSVSRVFRIGSSGAFGYIRHGGAL